MPKESNVWKYFTALRDDNGKQINKATCNKCADGKQFDTKGGTTNMWRHFLNDFANVVPDDQGDKKVRVQCNICHSRLKASGRKPSLVEVEHVMACIEQQNAPAVGESLPPPVQTRAPPGSGSSSTDSLNADLGAQLPPLPSDRSCPAGSSSSGAPGMDEPSKHLARMIALHGYDPSIVDNDSFRSFLGSLKLEFTMPSRVEIEKECNRVFDEARRDLLSRLSSSRGRVYLTLGRAKTGDKASTYIECHFIDEEWMLRKLVIGAFLVDDMDADYPDDFVDDNFILVPNPKLVIKYIDEINKIISGHGISNRLFMRRKCVGGYFWDALEVVLSDTNKMRESIFYTTCVDKVLHDIAQWLGVSHLNLSKDMEELYVTREKSQELISHLDLNDPWMYHGKIWYERYCCLKVLLMENTMICGRKHHVIEKYGASTLECLCKFLENIHHAIQRISAPSCPTSHLCLEELHKIRKFLKSESAHDIANKDGILAYGLREAIMTIDEYMEDLYPAWSIPLALDPRYKLQHICSIFKEAFEPEEATEYYSEVTKRITELYYDYINDEVGTSTSAGHSDIGVAVAVAAGVDDGDDPMHQWDWPSELKRYICDPAPPADDFDILNWWKENSEKYPTLARMARDALAMPTCSKPSSDEIAQIKSIVRGYSQKPFWRC